jgi:hypothetical protein
MCVVTGLANGTAYTFTVTATNGLGVSPASDPSNVATPIAGAPDEPTGVTAAYAGLASAALSWTAAFDNGSPITGYVATASPGGLTCVSAGALSCTVSGLTSGNYTFTVAATNARGTSAPSIASGSVTVYTGATFHPIPLVRVVDSRIGQGSQQLSNGAPVNLQFTGNYGIPTGATAITGTIAGISGSYIGYILMAPTPTACSTYGAIDNLPVAADTRTIGFTVGLSATGQASVVFCGSGTKQYILDVSGYYANDTTGGTYHPLNPEARLVDTRSNIGITGAIPGNTVKSFQVTGMGGVPANAVAVTGNAVAIGGATSGSITVGSTVTTSPGTSTVNFPAASGGDARSSSVTLGLSTTGTLSVVYPIASGSVAFVFEVTGYFTNDVSGYGFHAFQTPARLVDTRPGKYSVLSAVFTGKFYANASRAIPIAAVGSPVPGNATAVTGNLTVTNTSSGWALYAGPAPTAPPPTSVMCFSASDTRANGWTSGLASGYMYATFVSNGSNSIDLIFDVTGYFQ